MSLVIRDRTTPSQQLAVGTDGSLIVQVRDKTTPGQGLAIGADGSALIQPQALSKGIQGANGLSVQDLKDSGRVSIAWTIDRLAAIAITEAMVTVTQSKDGAATTTNAGYVITSGKRLRIQNANFSLENSFGAVALRNYLRLRFATAGSIAITSPIIYTIAVPTPAVAKGMAYVNVDFPDGIEFLGDGTKQIGVSWLSPDWLTGSQVATLSCSIQAFEY